MEDLFKAAVASLKQYISIPNKVLYAVSIAQFKVIASSAPWPIFEFSVAFS